MHRTDTATLVPAPAGTSVAATVQVAGLIEASREMHSTTVIDGGPLSAWHSIVDVDRVVLVGEASDVGVVARNGNEVVWTIPELQYGTSTLSFTTAAPAGAGATGLMQVMPNYWTGTAQKVTGSTNLKDPWTNIRTGAEILKQMEIMSSRKEM